MERENIRLLLDLKKYENMSEVSKINYMSVSTVSNRIKKIQNELGVKLVDVSTHGIKIHSGYEEIWKLIEKIDNDFNKLERVCKGVYREVRLGVLEDYLDCELGRLREITRNNDNVKISLIKTSYETSFSDLVEGKFDVLLTYKNSIASKAKYMKIGNDRICLVSLKNDKNSDDILELQFDKPLSFSINTHHYPAVKTYLENCSSLWNVKHVDFDYYNYRSELINGDIVVSTETIAKTRRNELQIKYLDEFSQEYGIYYYEENELTKALGHI